MIKTLNDLRKWAKSKGHRIKRWKRDDESCYRVYFNYGTDREIISAQYFYWVLISWANAMEEIEVTE